MPLTAFDLLRLGWEGQDYGTSNPSLPPADEADWQARVQWNAGSTLPKPTLADVEARRTELEAVAEAERRYELQRTELLNKQDKLLLLLEIMCDALDDIQAKARVTSALDATLVNKVDAARTQIAQIRALT